jgi:hypothetical protein
MKDPPSQHQACAMGILIISLAIIIAVSPLTTIAVAAILITFIYIIFIHSLPIMIKYAVKVMPLDIEPVLYQLSILKISESGVRISILAQVPTTKLPSDLVEIKISIDSLLLFDQQGQFLVEVHFEKPFIVNCKSDLTINQFIDVDFGENLSGIKVRVRNDVQDQIVKVDYYGEKELERMVFKAEIKLSISVTSWIFEILNIESLQVEKIINIREMGGIFLLRYRLHSKQAKT